MAEPLRSTGDTPRFDTYPAPADTEPEALLPAARVAGELEAGSDLNARAERVGNALGNVVGAVRRRLQVVPRRIDEAKERLTETGGDMRDDVRAAAAEWKDTAQRRLADARAQVGRYADQKPLHVIAGAALLGFAIGVGLRIWRSRNA
jgi:ElaB/YqjD/DUF883 family membrane-anchored ribosome-binding protein